MNTEQRLDAIEEKLNRVLVLYEKENWADRMVLWRYLELRDRKGVSIFSSKSDGLSLGFSGGKVGLYGVTPLARASGQSAPSGGTVIDTEARFAISKVINDIRNIGLTQ